MREFLRWVQFRYDDPLVSQYRDAGYPIRELKQYSGTTIVGFPTAPAITKLGMGDKLVTSAETTPDEQFEWLRLGEKYWIDGTDECGEPLKAHYGNQISFTLKYFPSKVSLAQFKDVIYKQQQTVKCVSVMPQSDNSSYEYLPEQPITSVEYAELVRNIRAAGVAEDVGLEHISCDSGACPIDFKKGAKEAAD
jgi:hypothetical protein